MDSLWSFQHLAWATYFPTRAEPEPDSSVSDHLKTWPVSKSPQKWLWGHVFQTFSRHKMGIEHGDVKNKTKAFNVRDPERLTPGGAGEGAVLTVSYI